MMLKAVLFSAFGFKTLLGLTSITFRIHFGYETKMDCSQVKVNSTLNVPSILHLLNLDLIKGQISKGIVRFTSLDPAIDRDRFYLLMLRSFIPDLIWMRVSYFQS